MSIDPSSPLVRYAAVIRNELQVMRSALAGYLDDREERPSIETSLLRALAAADEMLDQISPTEMGLQHRPRLRFQNDKGWDFKAWMHEKVTNLRLFLLSLYRHWSEDPRTLQLRLDAPVSPREFIRSGIENDLAYLDHNISKVFNALYSDDVTVEMEPEPDWEEPERKPSPVEGRPAVPALIRPGIGTAEVLKIGLGGAAWTDDEAAWRRGAFPDARARIDQALRGEAPPVRVINVQVRAGADFLVEQGRCEALLWHRWESVTSDLLDRNLRGPTTELIETQLVTWADAQPRAVALNDLGGLEIAVVSERTIEAQSFDGLSARLAEMDTELRAHSDAVRMSYEAELESISAHLPRSEGSPFLVVDMDDPHPGDGFE